MNEIANRLFGDRGKINGVSTGPALVVFNSLCT